MSKVRVTHSCGHIERHDLTGNARTREWRAERLAEELCSVCFQAARDAESAAAALANAEAGLPPLRGTERQVPWGESIRARKLELIGRALGGDLEGMESAAFWGSLNPKDPVLPAALDALQAQETAHFWIEHRDFRGGDLLLAVARTLPLAPAGSAPTSAREALGEATVRPEVEVTPTPVEIRVTGMKLELAFPEKRDDFRELVKGPLGYRWTGTAWSRVIDARSGPIEDRVAEAGNRLLAAGFPVRIFDPDLRARAIAGTFEPEHKRWVSLYTEGDFRGWVSMSWPREDDLYAEAKALPGSRYVKPNVAVPVARYEAIFDFVEAHGFAISQRAREALEAARAEHESALIARPAKAPRRRKAPGTMPATDGGIAPELLDDAP